MVRCYQAKMHSTKLPVSDRWTTCWPLCKHRPTDQSGSLTTFMTSAGGTNTYVITSNRLEKSWTLDWKCWLNTLLSKIYFIISVRSQIVEVKPLYLRQVRSLQVYLPYPIFIKRKDISTCLIMIFVASLLVYNLNCIIIFEIQCNKCVIKQKE